VFWSKYNSLFRSKQYGSFVYNSLSNALIQLDDSHYALLEQLHSSLGCIDVTDDNDQFLALLRKKQVIVRNGEEHLSLMRRQYKRNALCFDNSHLDLSICPTLGCNFQCPYCFENAQKNVIFMSAQTVDKLLAFIKSFKSIKSLSVSWYGGEPTINQAFNIVREITSRIKTLDVNFKEAGLITNAYLLCKDKIDELNDLNISNIQITLDGPQEVHDKRRVLAGGRPTFQTIIKNIDSLMNSSFLGNCNIRVNVDQSNQSSFFDIRSYLLERYKGKNLTVYAGHVDTSTSTDANGNCNLCAQEWTDFTVKQFRDLDAPSGEGVYPLGSVFNICSATTRNSFVIGPEGELYKCWEDVGRNNMIIGSVHDEQYITNEELVTQYSIGTDPYLDQECKECAVFPICSGGCANRRLRSKHFNENGMEYCSLYKDLVSPEFSCHFL